MTLSTTTQPLYLNIHNALIFCSTQVCHCLSSVWFETCVQVFLFPKFGVLPTRTFIGSHHRVYRSTTRKTESSRPTTSCNPGVTTRPVGLTTSLTTIFLSAHPGPSTDGSGHPYFPGPHRLTGFCSATKLPRIISNNSRERWPFILLHQRMLLLCKLHGYNKRQDPTTLTDLQKHKE